MGQGVDGRLNAVHGVLRQPEDGLEHQGHHRHEDEQPPHAVGHDAVDSVGEEFAWWARLAGDVLLNGEEPGVAGFDGGAAPVHTGRFEALASQLDLLNQGLGIPRTAGTSVRTERSFIAQEEQCLGGGQTGSMGKVALEGGLDGLGLATEAFGQFVELPGNDVAGSRRLGLAPQGLAEHVQSFAFARHHGNHRNTQRLGQGLGVDLVPLIAGDVDHVENQQRRVSQFDDLGREVEVALQVGGIGDDHDQIRRGHVGHALEQDVAGDLFVGGLRTQGIGSREIQNGDRMEGVGSGEGAFFSLHRDPGVVADAGAKAGQGVEQRGLAAVRVAGEDDGEGLHRFSGRRFSRPPICGGRGGSSAV